MYVCILSYYRFSYVFKCLGHATLLKVVSVIDLFDMILFDSVFCSYIKQYNIC